jgi:hypothetical protein
VYYEPKDVRKLQVDVEMEEILSRRREKEDIQEITGVFVGVCGPVELARDVVSAVGNMDGERRNRVGGIEIHEEYVSFFIFAIFFVFFDS